jgi:exodeoxyribonuclease VII large subunit
VSGPRRRKRRRAVILLSRRAHKSYSCGSVPRRPRTLSLPLDFTAEPALPSRHAPSPEALATPEPASPAEPVVLSVGELDRRLKRAVEGVGPAVHVEGEVSGLRPAASGHAYFILKDEVEEAMIDCVMYRSAPPRSRRLLAEGARVVLIGRPTFWAPRGRLQFTAEEARPAGRGALLEALERLKEKLSAEGLFDPERKRRLPAEPRVIGVVTSAGGAAIHDIVTVAFRRGAAKILLSPALVQGAGAAAQMIKAIALLERVPEVDVVILGRGGGSAEDLGAFNDEQLVRKVAASRVPIVSAVGHEIDTTFTDLAADARAATPSQAAELLVPDSEAREAALEHLRARLEQALDRTLEDAQDELDRLAARLGTPERLLAPRRQRVDDALERIEAAAGRIVRERRGAVSRLERRLAARHPMALISAAHGALAPLELRLVSAMRRGLAERRRALAHDAGSLDALSPLAVLGRGYAIATTPSGKAIRDAREVSPGDPLDLRVHSGRIRATVVNSVHDEGRSALAASEPAKVARG